MSNEKSLSELVQEQAANNAGQETVQAPVQETVPQAPVVEETPAPQAPQAPGAETQAFQDPGVMPGQEDGMTARLRELEQEAQELEGAYGSEDQIIQQHEMESRKQLLVDIQADTPKETVADVSKSKFNDEIVEVEEPEEEEKKDAAPPIDLTSIRIKKTKTGGKTAYARIRKSRNEATTQIVMPNTGMTSALAGFSSPELRNIATTLSSMDAYRAAEFRFNQIFSKIKDTSIGPISYEEFLRCTSLLEINILYYGVFCSTYQNSNKYPMRCTNKGCGSQFEYDYPNSRLMYIDDKHEITAQSILSVVKGINNAKDLLENSEVNTIERIYLDDSQTIVDLRHPSLWNELNDVLQNVTQQMMTEDEVTVNILPFVEAVYVLDPVDGTYVPLEDFDDKFTELSSLNEHDDVKLSKQIEKIIDKYHIKFGFRDVVCPHCNKKIEDMEIPSMETLLFTIHQLRTSNL